MIATALTLLLAGQASAENVYISNASEFVEFSDNANRGSNYYGTTVYLVNDIDISTYTGTSTLYPVGRYSDYPFEGTFDGLGYTISNLVQSYPLQYFGLFGYTIGSAIKNVVLDSSCSFKSTYSGPAYVGSVLGYCFTSSDTCTLDNIVNMADVSYDKYTSYSSYITYIGGIAGSLKHNSHTITVKNCANYGAVTRSNTYYKNYIGGIVGYTYYSSSNDITISNCLNSGAVSVTDSYYSYSSSELYVGGIVGYSEVKEISNCVSEGKITITNSKPSTSYVGSVIGEFYDTPSSKVEHCFWTANTSVSDGYGKSFSSLVVTDSSYIDEFNQTYADEMNDYIENGGVWAMNTFDGAFTAAIGNHSNVTYNATAIFLLGKFSGPTGSLDGWYLDEGYTIPLLRDDDDDDTDDADDNNGALYGKWSPVTFTIKFCYWDSDCVDESYAFGDVINYPTVPTREGYEFTYWEPHYETMPAESVTTTAQWQKKKYWVIYDYDYDGIVDEEQYDYEDTIYYPKPTRPGYLFMGWKDEVDKMPAHNVTVTAEWKHPKYTIKFIFNNGTDSTSKDYYYDDVIEYPHMVSTISMTFDGWNPYYERMPDKDVNAIAQWEPTKFAVTFDYGYDDKKQTELFAYEATVVYPTITRPGWKLIGWDKNITNMPAENVTVTAKWKIIYYTATFIFDDGTNTSKTYFCGNTIKGPEVPEKVGYTFDHWNPDYLTMPAMDMTFKAVYTKNEYYMIFNHSYDDLVDEVLYFYNDTVTYPMTARTGYELLKWDINVTTMPAGNVTATALWKAIDYAVRFYDSDETTIISSKTYHYEDEIEYPQAVKENYRFAGWSYKQRYMPASDLNITVKWERMPSDRVKVTVTGKELDEEGVLEVLEEFLGDTNVVVKSVKVAGGSTTAVIYFDDSLMAKKVVDAVESKMATKANPDIECDYEYYSGYNNKYHRDSASGAVALCVSALGFFISF